MNHIRWAAWGVIDIEALDRIQRRNYINNVRAELRALNIDLHCGGRNQFICYGVQLPGAVTKCVSAKAAAQDRLHKQVFAGKDAFKKLCAWLLVKLEDGEHERGTNGSVRSAGAEAEGEVRSG